jgi:hypothetical protein
MIEILAQLIRIAVEIYQVAYIAFLWLFVTVTVDWERLEDCRADL